MIFSILHFGYDLTHWAFLAPICGVNESVFQHLKMAFWAYLLASLIEYFVVRGKLGKKETFWYSRFLSTIIVPWFVVLNLVFSTCFILENRIFDIRLYLLPIFPELWAE